MVLHCMAVHRLHPQLLSLAKTQVSVQEYLLNLNDVEIPNKHKWVSCLEALIRVFDIIIVRCQSFSDIFQLLPLLFWHVALYSALLIRIDRLLWLTWSLIDLNTADVCLRSPRECNTISMCPHLVPEGLLRSSWCTKISEGGRFIQIDVKDVDSCMSLDSSMVCVDGKALGEGKKIEKYSRCLSEVIVTVEINVFRKWSPLRSFRLCECY